jgi:hypothetical protein
MANYAGAVYMAWGLFVQKVCDEIGVADCCVLISSSWDYLYISSFNVHEHRAGIAYL